MEEFKCILPKKTFADVKAENPDSEIVSFLIPCIMISSDKDDLKKELNEQKEILDLRIKNLEKVLLTI